MSILTALMGATIMAIVMTSVMTQHNSQLKSARHIAAIGGVTDLAQALDVLFSGSNCKNLGAGSFSLGNLPSTPVTVSVGGGCTDPSGYCLSLDTISFSSGAIAITSNSSSPGALALAQMIHPYSIASSESSSPGIHFTGLGGNSATASGFTYPFQMSVKFTAANNGSLSPSPLTKYIIVYTDASNRVIGACNQAAVNAGTTAPAYDSGWYNVTSNPNYNDQPQHTVTHNLGTKDYWVLVLYRSGPAATSYKVASNSAIPYYNPWNGRGTGVIINQQMENSVIIQPMAYLDGFNSGSAAFYNNGGATSGQHRVLIWKF